ncbi:hypothetical protein Aperf_G00000116704 [Anoplocephala perfoliata]
MSRLRSLGLGLRWPLRLNDGRTNPRLGFGTFNAEKGLTVKAVEEAIDAGYRHTDTAMAYGHEEELFCDKHDPKDVRKACEDSLKRLGLDYVDLCLVHFPASFHSKERASRHSDDPNDFIYEYHKLEDTWNAMDKLVLASFVKSTAVSNHNRRQIEHLIKHCKIVPAVNQVEVFGFELSEAEMDQLKKAGQNKRMLPWMGPLMNHPEYPFNNEF